MDLNGLITGGTLVPMIVVVAAMLVAFLVLWIIRRSAARMAQLNQAWIDQLPVSTGTRTAPSTHPAHASDTNEVLGRNV